LSAGRARPWRSGLAALGLYLALAGLLVGHGVLRHPEGRYVGYGNDAEIFVWMLRWWPHAIGDGTNPFAATSIFHPSGINLAWVTSVPGAALLAWPLTAAFGAVASYNVLVILAPALSAAAAYLLCRHVTGAFWPSLAGGYAYGFSSYVLGQSLGHLHAVFVPFAPLVALVLLRSAAGELTRRGTVLRLAPLLVLQFAFSTEVFLTLALAAGAGLALAAWVWPERRPALRETLRRGLLAGGVCAVLVSPFLVEALLHLHTGSINSPFTFSADLLNAFVPTRITLLGGDLLGPLSDRFRGNVAESGAYLGLPLLAVLLILWRTRRRERGVRFVLLCTAVSAFAALGPLLTIAGVRVFPLPWLPLAFVPVLENVLPVRLMAYASLAAAVALALFLAERSHREARWALGLAALVFLIPDVTGPYWSQPAATPDLRSIPAGSNVLVLPFASNGHGMLWQAKDGFRFDQAAGYVTPDPPDSIAGYPIVKAFQSAAPGGPALQYGPVFKQFLRARKVDYVAVDEGMSPLFGPLLDTLGVKPKVSPGLLVYDVRGLRS
jgi:hypothetical protein